MAHVPMDGFHLADAQLDRLGRARARARRTRSTPTATRTCCAASWPSPTRGSTCPASTVRSSSRWPQRWSCPPAARLVVTEGNYLLLAEERWERARAQLDEVWFVTGDDDVRRSRLVERHVTFGKEPEAAAAWVEQSDEANAALVAAARGPRRPASSSTARTAGRFTESASYRVTE